MPSGPFASALLALLIALGAPLDAFADERCQIVRASEAVVLVRGDTAVDAVAGNLLARSDRIETGAMGRATLRCDTGIEIVIGPDTVLRLDRVVGPNDTRPGVALLRGIAGFLSSRPRRGGFDVRTPSAVAAVRSTRWAVEVVDRATAAFVKKGRVRVAGVEGSAVLTAGEGIDVTAQGVAGAPKRWGRARVADLDRRLGADWTDR